MNSGPQGSSPHSPDDFNVGASIPVVRMLDAAKAKSFYIDYLGFTLDWEHRFHAESPLYCQIRLGDALLHLDGHGNDESPISHIRIPVNGIESFRRNLGRRSPDDPAPELVDPRGSGRGTDMNLRDPSGNLLTFWRSES